MRSERAEQRGDAATCKRILPVATALLLATSICGCTDSRPEEKPTQHLSGGAVVGRVEHAEVGAPLDGQKTLVIVADKGTNDGIRVGTEAYIRYHEAAMMNFRVYEVSDASAKARGWYDEAVKPGLRIIFNVGGLSDDQLFELSNDLGR